MLKVSKVAETARSFVSWQRGKNVGQVAVLLGKCLVCGLDGETLYQPT